jgi:hypothetical protein
MPKYYAVAIGHKVGIYESWKECEAQVRNTTPIFVKSLPNTTQQVFDVPVFHFVT